MNPWQMAKQLRHELTTVAWPEGSTDVVFGTDRVKVFAGTPTERQIPPGFPWALVGITDGTPDPDHPELIEQSFSIIVGAEVQGDPDGEQAVAGGPSADLGKSAARGVLEVSERARAAVQNLLGVDGAKILVSSTSAVGASLLTDAGQRHLALDEFTVTALCTSQLHYAAPQQLANSGDTWTWVGGDAGGAGHCSERFDFLQYRLGYKAGSTPPATPADADTLLTAVAVDTLTHTPVVGQAYAIFADYSARNPSQSIPASSIEGSSSGSEKGASLTT